MLNADKAPYFDTCPRCGVGGLETLKTHAFCVNCNYEEIYNDELCIVPQWVIDVLTVAAKPKKKETKIIENSPKVILRKSIEIRPDGSAA